MTPKHERDADIYRDYTVALRLNKPLAPIFKKYGLSRNGLYSTVTRIREGSPAAIRKAMESARQEILWQHKYRGRSMALPKGRSTEAVAELRWLIRDMAKDKLPNIFIAAKLGKDRSTIIFHLNSK